MAEMAAPVQTPPLTRIRITYGKSGNLRYIGNLDMHDIWLRMLRRTKLPLAYSKGYSPRPRFQVASSLPLGASSRCELLDAWMITPPPVEQICQVLTGTAPPGLEIVRVEEVSLALPALQTLVHASDYVLTVKETPAGYSLAAEIEKLLAADSLPREWRKKQYDLRPLVEELRQLPVDEHGFPRLFVRLTAREGATGRPEEILSALGLDPLAARMERTALHY